MIVLLNVAYTNAIPSVTFCRPRALRVRLPVLLPVAINYTCTTCIHAAATKLSTNGPPRAFARTRICFGLLPTNRQTTTMAQATVAAQIPQALDVQRHLAAQIAFDGEAPDFRAQRIDFAFRHVFDAHVTTHVCRVADLRRACRADTVQRPQCDHGMFVDREIDS